MSIININTINFNGQTAIINFSSDTGGTVSVGTYVLPNEINLDYYFGEYTLYFSAFNKTCTFNIVDHYLLQEDGFFLLQEDGSYIIIT